MSASAWKVYDQFELNLGKKLVDLSSDVVKCALFQSTSNADTDSLSPGTYATLTNEVAAANGYSTGGTTVAATWTNASGTITFDVADPTWTPTGTGIVARIAVLYFSVSGYLICRSVLDSSDVNVASIAIDAAGVFTLARA